MSVEGKNVEKKIEAGLISVLGESEYISTNSVSVRSKHSASEITSKMCVVDVKPLSSYEGIKSIYRVPVEILCVTDEDNDKNLSVLDGIYQGVIGVLKTKSASDITTAMGDSPGIVIDGFVVESGDEDLPSGNDMNVRTVRLTVFAQDS